MVDVAVSTWILTGDFGGFGGFGDDEVLPVAMGLDCCDRNGRLFWAFCTGRVPATTLSISFFRTARLCLVSSDDEGSSVVVADSFFSFLTSFFFLAFTAVVAVVAAVLAGATTVAELVEAITTGTEGAVVEVVEEVVDLDGTAAEVVDDETTDDLGARGPRLVSGMTLETSPAQKERPSASGL